MSQAPAKTAAFETEPAQVQRLHGLLSGVGLIHGRKWPFAIGTWTLRHFQKPCRLIDTNARSSITAMSGARGYGQSLQSNFIKEWRKARALKQDALARLLGVDRSLISKWENGVEEITTRHQQKIWDLVNTSISDAEKIEAGRLKAFQTPNGLFEFDGVRLLSASAGLLKIWPGAERLQGFAFEDYMLNEARAILDCRTTVDDLRSGDIVMISGASLRQSQAPNDDSPSILHNWHYVFRRIGGRLFVEMTMEAATDDTQVGIQKKLRLSDIGM